MQIDPVELPPGTVMFGPIGGIVPGLFPVALGQLLTAPRKELSTWRKWWKKRHCAIVDQDDNGTWIIQAMPRGAERVPLAERHWTRDYVYIHPAYGEGQGQAVADAARGYLGTPYNFLTYGRIGAGIFHLPVTQAVLRRWISSRDDMMCSQLVDQAQADADWHNFDDGRLPQDVVPAELYRALLTLPGRHMIPGDAGWTPNEDNSGLRRLL
jgi:hypothetical protein